MHYTHAAHHHFPDTWLSVYFVFMQLMETIDISLDSLQILPSCIIIEYLVWKYTFLNPI